MASRTWASSASGLSKKRREKRVSEAKKLRHETKTENTKRVKDKTELSVASGGTRAEVIFHRRGFITAADGLHYSILEGCGSTWVNTAIKETGVNSHINLP